MILPTSFYGYTNMAFYGLSKFFIIYNFSRYYERCRCYIYHHCVKCPYSELFWSGFSHIQTGYREVLRISPYSVRMREIWTRITPNTDTFYAAKTNSNNLIVPSRTKFSKKISHSRVDINCKTYDSIRHHKNILWFTLWDWINTEYIYRGYSRFFNPNIL